MSRGGKVKVITKTIKDQNVTEMFNQMLGTGAINLDMCYPKYENIKSYCNKILEILNVFNNSPFLKSYSELELNRRDINIFIAKSRIECDNVFSIDLSDYEWNLNLVDDARRKEFEEKYTTMKKSEVVFAFIKTCDNLIPYRKYIGKMENLDHKFLETMAGNEFSPFPFSNLNFKYIIDGLLIKKGLSEIKFVMTVLNKILTLSYNLYRVYNNPDFDVSEFAKVIVNNIGEVKKRIPRCEKAFKKIEESVDLLKENFNGYYKDYVQTQNQMIIMESFVTDVAKNTKADPETTREFRQIISYYRKMAGQQIKNPRMKQLFDKVNENFNMIDQHDNLVKIKSLSDSEGEEEHSSVPSEEKEKRDDDVKETEEEEVEGNGDDNIKETEEEVKETESTQSLKKSSYIMNEEKDE